VHAVDRPAVTASRTLVDSLWDARRSGGTVAAPADLSLDEGIDALRSLTDRALRAGHELIGWKLARLPPSDGANGVVFAAPVFRQSLLPTALAHARAPRLEVELVCRLGDAKATWTDLRWNVGMEIIDNHDPAWSTSAGWALADWGLHVGAKLGGSCQAPVVGTAIRVDVQIGDVVTQRVGAWRERWYETMLDALQRDCPRIVRPCAVGDLVWTGALVPAIELVSGTAFNAIVHGFGSVSSEEDL
jgi:2-keto-4-pentenoate hydratase